MIEQFPITFAKTLYRVTKEYFRMDRHRIQTVKDGMELVHSDWQDLLAVVSKRADQTKTAEVAIRLAATLVHFAHDLNKGIGRFDAELPADDLMRGTELALSPCCNKDSQFIGVVYTPKKTRWQMLCPCGKEWLY